MKVGASILKWEVVELMGYAEYAKDGYRILTSLVSTHDYDFVAERHGNFIRVNVKLAGLKFKARKNSWSISISSGAGMKNSDSIVCDEYLVYLPHQSRFIKLNGDFFVNSKSKSKLIPQELLAPAF